MIGNAFLDCDVADLTPYGIKMRVRIAERLGFQKLARISPRQMAYRIAEDGRTQIVRLW